MYTNQQELLHSQTNVEPQNNLNSSKYELAEREQIEGTPYWVCGNKDEGYILTFSKWQMTSRIKTIKEVKEFLEDNMINIILQTILCIVDTKDEVKQLVKKI